MTFLISGLKEHNVFETWRRSSKTSNVSTFFWEGVKYFRANLFDSEKGGSSMTFLNNRDADDYVSWWKEGKK